MLSLPTGFHHDCQLLKITEFISPLLLVITNSSVHYPCQLFRRRGDFLAIKKDWKKRQENQFSCSALITLFSWSSAVLARTAAVLQLTDGEGYFKTSYGRNVRSSVRRKQFILGRMWLSPGQYYSFLSLGWNNHFLPRNNRIPHNTILQNSILFYHSTHYVCPFQSPPVKDA